MSHECPHCGRSFQSNRALGVHKGRSHTEPWTDKEVLEEMYVEKCMTTREIAKELNCGSNTISRWLNKHGLDKKYKDEEVLRRLYIEEDMTEAEIANKLGCGSGTIHRWLNKHGIGTRPPAHEVADKGQDSEYNYIWWRKGGDWDRIRVHRLVAYAHGKLDGDELFNEKVHVHHKNGNAWINSPDNLQVLTPEEHSKLHFGRSES